MFRPVPSLILAATLVWVPSPLWADDAPPAPATRQGEPGPDKAPPPPGGARERRENRRHGGECSEMEQRLRERIQQVHDYLTRELQLTPEQSKKIEDICDAALGDWRAWRETNSEPLKQFQTELWKWMAAHGGELHALKERLAAAQKSGNKEESTAIFDQLATLLATRPKLPEAVKSTMPNADKITEQVRRILTMDQQKVFDRRLEDLKNRRDMPPSRPERAHRDNDGEKHPAPNKQAPHAPASNV